MLQVAKQLSDQCFFICMNTIANAADAVANDVKYHLTCWVLAQRRVPHSSNEDLQIQEIYDVDRVVADIEIINTVKYQLNCTSDIVLDMKTVNTTYNNLLGYSEGKEENFKRYLKRLLTENISDIVFVRPPARNEPERMYSNRHQSKAMASFKNYSDDYNTIFKAAKIVRSEALKCQQWKFTGDFEGFHIPQSLESLLHWIITGPQEVLDMSQRKNSSVDTSARNIGQIIIQSTKTKRQVNYRSSNASNNVGHSNTTETPFSVGLALHIHKETRSKKLIECLSELNLSINYKKLVKIQTEIANSVAAQIHYNNGVYIPPNITTGRRLHFAIDNTDFKNDTPDGKSEFHGTGAIVFQKKGNEPQKQIQIQRTSETSLKFQHNPYERLETCYKPTPPNEIFPDFTGVISCEDLNLYRNIDRSWGLCQVIHGEYIGKLPTWASYNSLATNSPEITKCQGLQLYPGTPTDWSNLYTSLKMVQGINVAVSPEQKTVETSVISTSTSATKPLVQNVQMPSLGFIHSQM